MHDTVSGHMANPVCEVPTNAPVIYLTRDHVAGSTLPVIDVWFRKPTRHIDTEDGSITWRGGDGADAGCVGTYTESAVRERFNILPGFDECVVLDNPKVN